MKQEGFDNVTLTLDDDREVLCNIECFLEVKGQKYIALDPFELPDDERMIYLYRYNEVNGEPELGMIETDDEYDAVVDLYDEWLDTQEFEDLGGED